MKKLFLIFGLAVLFLTACNDSSDSEKYGISPVYAASISNDYSANENTVYVCTGPNSKRYHRHSDCRGLDRCSEEIEAVTVSKAQSMGRTPCKLCY